MNKMVLAQNKDELHNLGSDDLLSQLPDDILVSLMSKLPLRDAVVTSKLSRRWRYLWCRTDRLIFEEDWERWGCIDKLSSKERNKYMSWVNHIIHQHKGPTIDKFKICFGLDKDAKGTIDEWIKFAVSKNVQTLELNFETFGTRAGGNYCFPDEIFDRKCGYLVERPVMEIKFLKSLILRSVDVNDEGLKKILSNCPVLEHLSILDSCDLVKAEICGKGLALKNLDIRSCNGLISLEIRDSDIVSFSCDCLPTRELSFDNLPKLEKICIAVGCSLKELNDMFRQLSSHVPYLQVLEFDLFYLEGSIELLPFPKLQKLKQLTFKVFEDKGLLVLPFLLDACPDLQRLTIGIFCWFGVRKTNSEVLRRLTKKPHQRLEVVEIAGYDDGAGDLELAMHFVQNCVALKKLVIRPLMKLPHQQRHTVNEITEARNDVKSLIMKLRHRSNVTREAMGAARNQAQQQSEPIILDGEELIIL